MVPNAREANPSRLILTRAHSDAEIEHLTKLGADSVIMGEREIARDMVDRLDMVHYDSPVRNATAETLRRMSLQNMPIPRRNRQKPDAERRPVIIDGIIAGDDEADVQRPPQRHVRLAAGLLVFLLAVIGLWLSSADPSRWLLRSSSQAADNGSQSPILGARDNNRAVLSADRRDLPKPNWTDPGHALAASVLAPLGPVTSPWRALKIARPVVTEPVFLGFLARAPPLLLG